MALATTAIAIGVLSLGQMAPLPHLGSLTDQLRAPARLAIAADDSVLVTDPLNRHIVRFDPWGGLLATQPVAGVPIGVAVHPDGRVFVSLRDQAKVAIYDSEFEFLEYLGEVSHSFHSWDRQTSTSPRTRVACTSWTRMLAASTSSSRTERWR